MDRELCFESELVESCQKVSDHGDPDLSEHGIGSYAEGLFDLEVLFDTFEKQFDLPASLVDVRNRSRGEFKVVSEERICLAGFGVDVSDTSQPAGVLSAGIESGENDLVIGSDAGGFTHAA